MTWVVERLEHWESPPSTGLCYTAHSLLCRAKHILISGMHTEAVHVLFNPDTLWLLYCLSAAWEEGNLAFNIPVKFLKPQIPEITLT